MARWSALLNRSLKPAGKGRKKGVVRDKAVHEEVIHKVIDHAVEIGFHILNLEYSPIKGPEEILSILSISEKKPKAAERNPSMFMQW